MKPSQLLFRYVGRQVAGPFAIGAAILLALLSLERLLRLLDLVTANGGATAKVFVLLLDLLPHYLILALPASFFLAVLLGFRRLQDNSELAVLQAAGVSIRTLLRPVLLIAAVATVAMVLLTGLVDPYARYAYRAAVYDLSASGQLVNIQPGVFTKIGADTIVRADTVTNQGRYLAGVFLAARRAADGTQTFVTAKTAAVQRNEETGIVTLTMQDGTLVHEGQNQGPDQHPGVLAFQSYPWDLPAPTDQPYGSRGRDERELTSLELARGLGNTDQPRNAAELAVRLVQSLSLPFLALLAVPLALLGGGRTGQAYGIGLGCFLLILYDKVLGFGQAAAAAGHLSPWLSVWGPLVVLAGVGWWLLAHLSPRQRKRMPAAA